MLAERRAAWLRFNDVALCHGLRTKDKDGEPCASMRIAFTVRRQCVVALATLSGVRDVRTSPHSGTFISPTRVSVVKLHSGRGRSRCAREAHARLLDLTATGRICRRRFEAGNPGEYQGLRLEIRGARGKRPSAGRAPRPRCKVQTVSARDKLGRFRAKRRRQLGLGGCTHTATV
ncbi:hypothetical protein OH76DRAFT_315195 [Lentinus brumalis]|uniref:Uncharacterized protein n=1 Tax=Lentinus brumalis TaxID=2498619 RepID=A0A371DFE5_9APHY|nr:hypothetical protein OH76DRAFT_315195 [Polyporus brumalis]